MILINDLRKAIHSLIEAEGTDRFTDELDVFPAIDAAVRSLNGLALEAFGENKGGEEFFREVTVTRIFQTNTQGGVSFIPTVLGHQVWSVLAVYPTPELSSTVPLAVLLPGQSKWVATTAMASPGPHQCKRITLEQVAQTTNNKAMAGNEKLADSKSITYAYYWVGDRRAALGFIPQSEELVVLPKSKTSSTLVAISYIRGLDPITDTTPSIPYPQSALQVLRNLSLNEMAIKMGQRPLFDVSLTSAGQLIASQT